MTMRKRLLLVGSLVCCLLLGGVGGYYLCECSTHVRELPEIEMNKLLYGNHGETRKYAREVLGRSGPFFAAVSLVGVDYRGVPSISPDRKILLMNCLAESAIDERILNGIALCAVQDPHSEVRLESVWVIHKWNDTIKQNIKMLDTYISREKDERVKQAMMDLIAGESAPATCDTNPTGYVGIRQW